MNKEDLSKIKHKNRTKVQPAFEHSQHTIFTHSE